MANEPNLLIKLFWRVHPKIYHWSLGRIGGSLMGLPVLLLTTKGRKSRVWHTKALMYLPYNEDFVVIASNLGQAHHPMWWLNLQAEPNAKVEIRGTQYPVQAREAIGEERSQIWQALIAKAPSYDDYKQKTDRQIPVVILENQCRSTEV
jgi:deazaflavin-dependent oxidoreductase (nitroreductase family)